MAWNRNNSVVLYFFFSFFFFFYRNERTYEKFSHHHSLGLIHYVWRLACLFRHGDLSVITHLVTKLSLSTWTLCQIKWEFLGFGNPGVLLLRFSGGRKAGRVKAAALMQSDIDLGTVCGVLVSANATHTEQLPRSRALIAAIFKASWPDLCRTDSHVRERGGGDVQKAAV